MLIKIRNWTHLAAVKVAMMEQVKNIQKIHQDIVEAKKRKRSTENLDW